MIKKILCVPALALALSFSQISFAHDSSNNTQHKHHFCMVNLHEKLDLTDDQKAKIKTIKAQNKAESKGQRQQLRSIHEQMKPLVRTHKLDEAKVDKLIAEKKDIMGSMMKSKVMMRHQIYNVLDMKQKAKFDALSKQCEEKRAHKHS